MAEQEKLQTQVAGAQAPIKSHEPEQAPIGSQMGQSRPCPKDCRKCSWMQQVCCSSMMTFQMFGLISSMMEKIDAQSKIIADLSGRIAALEVSATELTSPMPVQGELFPDTK